MYSKGWVPDRLTPTDKGRGQHRLMTTDKGLEQRRRTLYNKTKVEHNKLWRLSLQVWDTSCPHLSFEVKERWSVIGPYFHGRFLASGSMKRMSLQSLSFLWITFCIHLLNGIWKFKLLLLCMILFSSSKTKTNNILLDHNASITELSLPSHSFGFLRYPAGKISGDLSYPDTCIH